MSATSEVPAGFRNAAGDRGPIRLVTEGFNDVRSRRRLVRYLVQADIHKRGADTLLGNIWWVLDPLLQMVVYVVFLSIIVTNRPEDYPLFVFAAILPWKWFSASMTDATTSIVRQDQLIKQIQFPKIVLPFAAVYSGIANFAFGMIPLFILLLLFYRDRLTPNLLFIAPIAGVQFVFTLALGFIVSAINVFFRDLGNVARHVLRLWFYLSPGLYSMALLEHSALFEKSPTLTTLVNLNPFAILFTAYRSVIYGTDVPQGPPMAPDWAALGLLLGGSLVLLALTTLVFKRLEPSFAKVL